MLTAQQDVREVAGDADGCHQVIVVQVLFGEDAVDDGGDLGHRCAGREVAGDRCSAVRGYGEGHAEVGPGALGYSVGGDAPGDPIDVDDFSVDAFGYSDAEDGVGECLPDGGDRFVATSEKIVHGFDLSNVAGMVRGCTGVPRVVNGGGQGHVDHGCSLRTLTTPRIRWGSRTLMILGCRGRVRRSPTRGIRRPRSSRSTPKSRCDRARRLLRAQ